jgi:hypothetical protein
MTIQSLFERSVHNMDYAVISQEKKVQSYYIFRSEISCTHMISPVGSGETSEFIRGNRANDAKVEEFYSTCRALGYSRSFFVSNTVLM